MKLFKCIYVDGSGKEYDGGIWERKETPKTIVFKQIKESFFNPKESFFNPNWNFLKIYKDKTKRNKHVIKEWSDGTYTIYPEQCGTPHLFTPITKSEFLNYKEFKHD